MNRLIISLEEKLHKGIVSFVYLKKMAADVMQTEHFTA